MDIEKKLRKIASYRGAYVFALLDCCRVEYPDKFKGSVFVPPDEQFEDPGQFIML